MFILAIIIEGFRSAHLSLGTKEKMQGKSVFMRVSLKLPQLFAIFTLILSLQSAISSFLWENLLSFLSCFYTL